MSESETVREQDRDAATLPDPLPAILSALRRATSEWDRSAFATPRDVRRHLPDDGRGLPVTYALKDLVRFGAAVVMVEDDVLGYRPTSWR